MTTYPQAMIPVFTAGTDPTQAIMQGWVQQTFQFLTAQPVFRGIQQLSGGQSLSSSSIDPLKVGGTIGDILEDPYGGWSTSATSSQPAWSYLVPYTGLYEVTIDVPITGAAVWLNAAVALSGGTPYWMESALMVAGLPGGCSGSLIFGCTGGQDYIQAGTAVSGSATTDTASPGVYPSLEIAYLSGG